MHRSFVHGVINNIFSRSEQIIELKPTIKTELKPKTLVRQLSQTNNESELRPKVSTDSVHN